MVLNHEVVRAKWMQLKGRIKERRAALTRNRVERLRGAFEVRIGKLQERRAILAARVTQAVRHNSTRGNAHR